MYHQALLSLSILFFMMGFITCLNDILVPYLKEIFKLDYAKAALVQFCFFGAYGLTSIPASKVIERFGYHKGMVLGFCITAVGCLLFIPASSFHAYGLFLLALFVLASGVVLLQVAANPYVSVIGSKETASSRLTMVQAFNSFGTFLAPFFGSFFILENLDKSKSAGDVHYPYILISVVLIMIALLLQRLKLPEVPPARVELNSWKDVLRNKNLLRGLIGIFAYVGAEVAIGTFMVNYIISMVKMPKTDAATYVAVYWGSAMAGRFIGTFTLKEFPPGRVLFIHAMLAISLILISINSKGLMSIYSIVVVGFCNSVMFPTIFTLGIKDLYLGQEQKASGLLATAIIGGAIIPLITGEIADKLGLRMAFLFPVLCYAYIAYFGVKNSKVKELATETIH